ncbi:MAG: Sua5/YciO/YrdC/YwlC family protein [Thermoplasmata archaeon]
MEIKCSEKECSKDCEEGIVSMANEVLDMGELIVYPTETLYGLGADATKSECIRKVRMVKGSPLDQGISTAYLDMEHAAEYLKEIPDIGWELGKRFTPGPLTIVLEIDGRTEGIRIPDQPLARKIIEDFGPITATSANRHGFVSPGRYIRKP